MNKKPVKQDNHFETWIKPIAIILAVFIIGFAVPVLLKNYLSQKTGLSPSPTPENTEIKLEGPSYRLSPNKLKLNPGETTEIKVYMDTDRQTIEAFDFLATYDQNTVSVTSVEATPLFPSYPSIEYGNGEISIGGNIGIDESFSTSDLMAVITVEGKASGKTTLQPDKKNSTIASQGENILNAANSVEIVITSQ